MLGASAISQLAGSGHAVGRRLAARPAINPTQFGEFLEEINHSGDGGLYAELIRNRDLKESTSSPVAWSAVSGWVEREHLASKTRRRRQNNETYCCLSRRCMR